MYHCPLRLSRGDRGARELDGPPKKYIKYVDVCPVYPPGKCYLDEVKAWQRNHQESRWILEALFLTSCDKIIQRRNSARTFGTCDDVVCEPLFGVMLVSGCSGIPSLDYPNWTLFWRFDDLKPWVPEVSGGVMRMFMVHGPFRGRPWLMDQEDRLTSLWPPRGFLAEWAEWLREPPIFSNENLDPQYGKPKGTSPYCFAGHHPQLSYWGCSLDPWDSLHLFSAAPIHWRWSN